MSSRYVAIVALALSLGGWAAGYRVPRASQFRLYYHNLHDEYPQLNAWQRVLASLVSTSSE